MTQRLRRRIQVCWQLGVPVLGICYGLQFIVHHLGGKVVGAAAREYGHAEVTVVAETPLFRGLPGIAECVDVAWRSCGGAASGV